MSILKNVNRVQVVIEQKADRPVKIVAVTKKRSVAEMMQVIDAGLNDIAENRADDAQEKIISLPKGVTKHFIGRLQTNKVSGVVQYFDMIQSVDRLKLAQKINSECEKINRVMPILIQVNTSKEPQKGGVLPAQLKELIEKIQSYKNIKIEGLMTLAIDSDNEREVRQCFAVLKSQFDELKQNAQFADQMTYLSMGMSKDYPLALEEGANMIRLGSALFL